MSTVSVIINNFNTKELLLECVTNLVGIAEITQIIVSDSGSTDGSADVCESVFKENSKVIVIRRPNDGVAKGYNAGLKIATGNYILYLGTDAFPKQETISGLIAYCEDPQNADVGIATTKLVTRSGEEDIDAHRGPQTPWSTLTHFAGLDKLFPKSKVFAQYFLSYEDMSKPHEVATCISHFMFVRKSAQDKVGMWDEDYFVYGEDVDICYRMRLAGYKVMYLPQWTTLHIKGATMGRKSAKDLQNSVHKSPIVKHVLSVETTRAMKLHVQKHLTKVYPKPLIWLVYLGIFLLQKLRIVLVGLTFSKK